MLKARGCRPYHTSDIGRRSSNWNTTTPPPIDCGRHWPAIGPVSCNNSNRPTVRRLRSRIRPLDPAALEPADRVLRPPEGRSVEISPVPGLATEPSRQQTQRRNAERHIPGGQPGADRPQRARAVPRIVVQVQAA